MTEKAYQQGDLVLKLRVGLPQDATLVKAEPHGYVLAEGEATGHRHTMEAVPGVELFEAQGTLWLRVVGEPRTLMHQEHAPQTVEPGVYEVHRVVEVDPFENEVRTVAD